MSLYTFTLIAAFIAVLSSNFISTVHAAETCISLANTTQCQPWAGQSVLSSSDFTSVAEFDQYVSDLITPTGIAKFKEDNNCNDWDGHETRRYYKSLICATVVSVSTSNGCNKKAPQLCKSTVDESSASIESMFNNTSICTANAERGFNTEPMETFINNVTHPTTDCILATKEEWGSCGFIADLDAQNFCADSANANEKCCAAVALKKEGKDFSVPTVGLTSKQKTAIICGVVFGVLGLILLIILIVFLFKRRNRKDEQYPDGLQAPYSMQHKAMYEIPQPNYSNEADAKSIGNTSNDVINAAYEPSAVSMSMDTGNGEIHTTLYNYVPNLSDEIYLYTGDEVQVFKRFDDGWGYGKNLTTMQTGSFPLACVEPTADSVVESQAASDRSANRFSVRASSMGWIPSNRSDKAVSYADTINQQ